MTWLTPRGLSFEVITKHFPLGIAWMAWRNTTKNAGKFLKAVASLYEDAWSHLSRMSDEIDYRTGEQLLPEWEAALGLPDKCLPSTGTLADRRKWIAFRLNKKRWNTLADWQELATLFGVNVRITPGYLVQKPSLYKAVFPVPVRILPKLGRFRIYIDLLDAEFGGFPYDGQSIAEHKFPIPFGKPAGDFQQFRCFIERVKPANVLIVWNEFPAIPPHGNQYTFSPEFDEEYS